MSIIIDYFNSLGAYIRMTFKVIRSLFSSRLKLGMLRDAFFDMGVKSLPVVAITGFSTGMMLAAQAFFQLSDKGLAGTTGLMVTKSMIVELGPILTAFMITGRVGAAITAEIGTMKVTEQIDALSSMAVSPIVFLVQPRFLAMLLIAPLLTIFSATMGISGGFLIAVDLYGMAPSAYINPIPIYVNHFDMVSGLCKSIVFGFLIVTISSYRGFLTRGGAHGVGQATTKSVVICYAAILISNFILTVMLNASYWYFFKT
jgi:phospholipid/cholesterol/gamma-HCH transport system permease protein